MGNTLGRSDPLLLHLANVMEGIGVGIGGRTIGVNKVRDDIFEAVPGNPLVAANAWFDAFDGGCLAPMQTSVGTTDAVLDDSGRAVVSARPPDDGVNAKIPSSGPSSVIVHRCLETLKSWSGKSSCRRWRQLVAADLDDTFSKLVPTTRKLLSFLRWHSNSPYASLKGFPGWTKRTKAAALAPVPGRFGGGMLGGMGEVGCWREVAKILVLILPYSLSSFLSVLRFWQLEQNFFASISRRDVAISLFPTAIA